MQSALWVVSGRSHATFSVNLRPMPRQLREIQITALPSCLPTEPLGSLSSLSQENHGSRRTTGPLSADSAPLWVSGWFCMKCALKLNRFDAPLR